MATSIVKLANGEYIVDSMSGATRSYRVNVDDHPGSCTCPHFQNRLKEKGEQCKHIVAVLEFEEAEADELKQRLARSRYCKIVERAEALPTERLKEWAKRYQLAGDAEVWGALLVVLAKRKEAAKPVLPAPLAPAFGRWEKTFGPETDEAARAIWEG